MSTQPLALTLADALENSDTYNTDAAIPKEGEQAAAELRRLHEVNQELLEALESTGLMWPHIEAVIAKARSAS